MAAPRASQPGTQTEAEAARLNAEVPRHGEAFLAASRRYLLGEYPAKIDVALNVLDDADCWWRPAPEVNSVGHLIRHLSGNVRQWIVHGVGGAPDRRRRSSEFEAPPRPIDEVRADLADALDEADRVLSGLAPDDLGERRSIQGLDTTVFDAVYHVVEHFSMHTGQILWIAKARSGRDLGLYEVDDGGRVVGTNW